MKTFNKVLEYNEDGDIRAYYASIISGIMYLNETPPYTVSMSEATYAIKIKVGMFHCCTPEEIERSIFNFVRDELIDAGILEEDEFGAWWKNKKEIV